jgi:hypothetical protein
MMEVKIRLPMWYIREIIKKVSADGTFADFKGQKNENSSELFCIPEGDGFIEYLEDNIERDLNSKNISDCKLSIMENTLYEIMNNSSVNFSEDSKDNYGYEDKELDILNKMLKGYECNKKKVN